MSLIEEALRRMQEPLVNPPATAGRGAPVHPWPVTPAAPGGPPSLEASTTTNPLLPTTLAVVILTVAMVVGGAVWLGHTLTRSRAASSNAPRRAPGQPVSPPVDASSVHASTPQAETTAPVAAAPASPASASDEAFALTGVVEGVGEPYAMINGVIVAVGERVGTATLLEIANGTVRLRLETGEERVLRVPR